jgi:two-component system, NtrC family, sensor kinase
MKSKMNKTYFICLILSILYSSTFGQKTNIYQQQIDSIIKRQALNSNDSVRIVDMSNLTNYYFLQYDFTKGFSSLNQLKRMTYKPSPQLTDLYYYNSLKYFFWNNYNLFIDYYAENEIAGIANKIGKPNSIETSESPKITEDFFRNQFFYALKTSEISSEQYNKALVFSLLSLSYMRTNSIDSVVYYDKMAFEIFDKIGKREEAFSLITSKILFYNALNQRDSLKGEESKAIVYTSNTFDKKAKANLYSMLGYVYDNLNRHSSTIQCLMKSNEIWEELGYKEKQVETSLAIGRYSGIIKDYVNEKNYALQAFEIQKQIGDTVNLYTFYYQMVFNAIMLKNKDEANRYAILARNALTGNNDLYDNAKVLDAEGQVLMANGRYIDAINKFLQSANGFEKANRPVHLSYPYLYIAQCYDSLNQLNDGIKYATLCHDLSIKHNWSENLINSSQLLAQLYSKKGDLAKAYRFLAEFTNYKKEFDEKNERALVADFEAQNKININQKRIELLQNDNKINALTRNFSIGIASLLLLLVGGVYYRFQSKQRDNKILEKTLSDLKSTQTQLIQKEKLASLGELTAGIAHEIQNPLNFVNNFSELSVDLAKDLKEEIHKPDIDKEYVEELLTDLSQNQEKINHHGKRASSIVKGMLEHSRASTGVKEMTDINALADEYFRLSYHGLRAKDKDFNATMETDFDKNLPKINVIPQDMGRVLLNLFNNAFYAVNEKSKLNTEGVSFKPTVFLSTQLIDNQIVIKVNDNGSGMPESVKAKVFQPFFTTKPTGSGTGLGLSLAYDIVTKGHGGTLEVESIEGKGTTFIIKI